MSKHHFIIDKEIDLFEKQGEGDVRTLDSLNTTTYVNTLTDCVMSAPENTPFTIGLFGEWGSGKSSIIKTFSKDVVEKYKAANKNVKVITYDAWKYSNDSFRRMFLLQMQKELGYRREQLMNSFYLNSSEDVDIKQRINSNRLYIGLFVALLLIVGLYFLPISDPNTKILANTLVALCSLLYTIYIGAIQELKVNIQKPHMFAPEQFEACYDEMTDMALGAKRDIFDYIKPGDGVTGLHRLIIVIDNVDRCTTELAYELLTNIKNFLGQKHNTVFIIPVDEEALKKHIVNNKPSAGRESDEFLRKFFNICIRIKPFKYEEMYSFAWGLNVKNQLGLLPTTVSLVANEFASNPRRIIQMFNNLLVELDSLPEEISNNHQPLICKLLIIREEYPDFYKKLLKDSKALFRLEDLEDKKDKEGKVLEKSTPQMQAVLRFLKATTAVTSTYDKNLAVVERILTNSNIFEKLPKDVLQEYDNMQFGDTTLEFVKESSRRLDLVNYVLDRLETAIKRGLWDTDVKNSFDRLLALNKQILFMEDENMRVVRVIEDHYNFDRIAEKQENLVQIIEYAAGAEKQNIEFCADWLSLFIINNNRTEIKYLDALCLACKMLSSDQVKKLNKVVLKACEKNMAKVLDNDYGDNSSVVYTDKVFDYLVNQLPTEKGLVIECIIKIASSIDFKKEWLKKTLSALANIVPDYDIINNSNFDEERGIMEGTTQLLSLCHHIHLDKFDIAEIDQFTETISKYTLEARTNRQRGFILNNLDNQDFIDSLISFIHEYVIISKSTYRFPETINTIAAKNNDYAEKINDLIAQLKDEGYPIDNYTNTILETNTYNPTHIRLLDFILKFKNKANKYLVDDSDVAAKFKVLLDKCLNTEEPNKSQYETAILNIANDERNKQILRQHIQELDSTELGKLPNSLFNYAIQAFEDHLDDYKANYKILTLLFNKGSQYAKKKVLAIVTYNLVSNKSLDNDLQLIMSLTGLAEKEKDSLKESLELAVKDNPTYMKKIGECLEYLGFKKEFEEDKNKEVN